MRSLNLSVVIRKAVLRMVHAGKASHVASSLSMADLIAVLYEDILRVDPAHPDWPARDRLLVSKGHAAPVVYAVLAEMGFFSEDHLEHYCQTNSPLLGHVSHHVPGVEWSTGSLGHGLSVGCGMALAAKRDGLLHRVFVLLSDGELDEGATWEAALFAPQHGLDNLIVIVDYNKMQAFGRVEEILDLSPLADKWRAFHWAVREIDGHDHEQIAATLATVPWDKGRPSVVIAHTIKGKGVSFMEGQLAWHYKSPDAEQLRQALSELGGSL